MLSALTPIKGSWLGLHAETNQASPPSGVSEAVQDLCGKNKALISPSKCDCKSLYRPCIQPLLP